MVGSAIHRLLLHKKFTNIITATSTQLDLRDQNQVNRFFAAEKPDYVFFAAAKVGGIAANNNYRANFIYDNLMMQTNVIHAAHVCKVKKLLFLGSSCIYPKLAPQPLKEEYLLTGLLEYTNEPYAIAKIAGIKMCEAYREQYGCNFISVMPTNMYGFNDNYDLHSSHVLPALLRKIHEAKITDSKYVEIWGSGKPYREFMYVDDCAEACLFLMQNYDGKELINVGTGKDQTIAELALMIKEVVGFKGQFTFNTTMPDGTPRKMLDVSKLNRLGWRASTPLTEGIKKTYENFLSNYVQAADSFRSGVVH